MITGREDAEERFPKDIAGHQMTVIRDDGVYRHLRFSRPDTRIMSFDILTWPGYLAYVGDMGDYVFSRLTDMFEFFRHDHINPQYWAEKIQAACDDGVKEYSEAKAREWVQDSVKDASEAAKEAAKDINFDDGADEVYRQLRDFDTSDLDDEHDLFFGWEEANFQVYSYRYIWCCLAIVWAIKQYDAKPARFYLLSLKHHKAGDNLTWWRPDERGYCWSLDAAGLYDEETAKRIEAQSTYDGVRSTVAIPEAVALRCAHRMVEPGRFSDLGISCSELHKAMQS